MIAGLAWLGYGPALAQVPTAVQLSFAKVAATVGYPDIELVRINKALAVAVHRTIGVSAALETYSEIERQFVLAHEVGHILNGDSYLDPLDNRNQQHFRELRADSFAVRVLHNLGWSCEAITTYVGQLLIDSPGTSTHPSGSVRVMNLQQRCPVK